MIKLTGNFLALALSALIFQGCVGQGGATSNDLGVDFSGKQNASENELADAKILKIIYQSNTTIFQDYTLNVTDNVTVRAGLFDIGGEFLGTAPAAWSLNTGFSSSDLVVSLDDKSATFTPTNIGSAKITAVYTGSDASVITTTDATGNITVTHTQVPDSILITAGNNQSGVVNTNLTDELEVEVQDSFGVPIQGISVTFSVATGSGSIIGTNPVFTNASGRASVPVKLGTVAGGGNNSYRAHVTSDPTIFTDFSANALPGAPGTLAFINSPGLSYAGILFSSTPRVQIRDSFSNPIDLSTGSVTLSVQTGSGALSGTTTQNLVNGVATFDDLSYDTAEAGVILRASYGAITGDSLDFEVLGSPPGACVTEVPGAFHTAHGGCHDVANGLTWSKGSNYVMNFYQSIWDSRLPGASAPDEHDYGRTNDYSLGGCNPASFYCDNDDAGNTGVDAPSTLAYCHDLVQGGYEDWRLPTREELQDSIANKVATGESGAVINYHANTWHKTSTLNTLAAHTVVGIETNAITSTTHVSSHYVICVRGNWSAPTKLRVTSAPTEMRYGINTPVALKVQIEQADGTKVNAQDVPITLSAVTTGGLYGTLVANTNEAGIATFSNFNIRDAALGTNTITVSSPGLADATFDVDYFFKQKCDFDDGITFSDESGGCKQISTDLIWSSRSNGPLPWARIVAQSEINGVATTDDEPSINYCQDLVESGYSDWRTPTTAQLQALALDNGINLGDITGSTLTWGSTSVSTTQSVGVEITTGALYTRTFATAYYALCVRDP